MIVRKGFKYKLKPTKKQKQMLLQHGGNTRFLWNYFLKLNKEYYKETGKFKFFYELAMLLPKLKKEYLFIGESFSQSLQVVAKQFDISLRGSFKKTKGFPSFKKKGLLTDSFTCPQTWKLYNKSISIPKIGKVKWIKHREIQGKPKSITISQDGEKWYCSVLCEVEIEEKEKKVDNIVGCDVGIKNFATLSDGTIFENPKYLKKYEKKLSKYQRRLSKKQKGSKNRLKQRMKVRSIHTKIKNTRTDFLHKTTSSMIAKYDGVVVEDLNIAGMLKNKHLSKSIGDASWSEFIRQLSYKAIWNSKYFIQIGRFEPTSKTCSSCNCIQEMPLNKRQYDCPICGVSIDRDLNASINIRNLGLNTLGFSGIEACGVAEATRKQECLN